MKMGKCEHFKYWKYEFYLIKTRKLQNCENVKTKKNSRMWKCKNVKMTMLKCEIDIMWNVIKWKYSNLKMG